MTIRTIIALTALMVAVAGCKTTLILTANNETQSPLEYKVKVDGEQKLRQSLHPGEQDIQGKVVGKFETGKPVQVSAAFTNGGRVQVLEESLRGRKHRIPITTRETQGTPADFDAGDIETWILDLRGSFRAPDNFPRSFIENSLNGIYRCTDNHEQAADPRCELIYTPGELGIENSVGSLYPPRYPASLEINKVLDRRASAQLGAEIMQIASVKANFEASQLYKYDLKFEGVGWRQTGPSWEDVRDRLQRTRSGRRKLARLREIKAGLEDGREHLYYLNQWYPVMNLEMATYQAQQLGMDVDVTARNYLAFNAAFAISNQEFDRKAAQHIILRVKYMEIRDIPQGDSTTPELVAEAAVRYDMVPVAEQPNEAEGFPDVNPYSPGVTPNYDDLPPPTMEAKDPDAQPQDAF